MDTIIKQNNMKLTNPILLTLNNTLHIKADNLEAVEVEINSANEIMVLHLGCTFLDNVAKKNEIKRNLKQGIPLPQELSDRIEVRNGIIDLGLEGKYDDQTPKAFLLPSKEDKRFGIEYDLKPKYTIEEIERAIDESVRNFDTMMSTDKAFRVKQQILNNLKK